MWGLMIICYICMIFSFILLSITGFQGYFQFMILEASYQEFSLLSIIIYMFSETLIMFYFIGSGTAIKKEINQNKIKTDTYLRVKKTKMILFPHITINICLIGLSFILIGAVDTGMASSSLQQVIFLFGYLHFVYTLRLQHVGFKENIDLLIELADSTKYKSAIS